MAQLGKYLLYRPEPQNLGEKSWRGEKLAYHPDSGGQWGGCLGCADWPCSHTEKLYTNERPSLRTGGLCLLRNNIPGFPLTFM